MPTCRPSGWGTIPPSAAFVMRRCKSSAVIASESDGVEPAGDVAGNVVYKQAGKEAGEGAGSLGAEREVRTGEAPKGEVSGRELPGREVPGPDAMPILGPFGNVLSFV